MIKSPAARAFYMDEMATCYLGDVREVLSEMAAGSFHCVVTSPPYWGLRDYGVAGQLGLEPTPEEYVANMVEVFEEVRRVLRKDGTLWLNVGDCYSSAPPGNTTDGLAKWASSGLHGGAISVTYARTLDASVSKRRSTIAPGLKPKDLVGMPWRLAFALQAAGWYLRSDIIWSKPNPMPESVTDRPTKAHEYVFLLSKSARYYYDADAIRTPLRPKTFTTFGAGRNPQPDDAGGLVKTAHWHRDIPERRPRMKMPDGRDAGKGKQAATQTATAPGSSGERTYAGFNRRWKESQSDAVAGANARTVWEIATQPYPDAHFATFPEALVEPCIKAGCPAGGIVLDPFAGSGTTLVVAKRLGRHSVGIDLNPEYVGLLAKRVGRITHEPSLFGMNAIEARDSDQRRTACAQEEFE